MQPQFTVSTTMVSEACLKSTKEHSLPLTNQFPVLQGCVEDEIVNASLCDFGLKTNVWTAQLLVTNSAKDHIIMHYYDCGQCSQNTCCLILIRPFIR